MLGASSSNGGPGAPVPEPGSRNVGAPSTDLSRLLIESVRDYAIFALDPDGYILSWNIGAERIKGYRPHEIIGKHFSVFYPAEQVANEFPAYELRMAAKEGRFEDEGWRLRKDGTRFWANVIITALRDETGTLVGFAKVTRDLTERRKADQELRLSEERFRLLVEGVKDYAIFMLDQGGHVTTWNQGAERINGYTSTEILGQHFSKFYTAESLASNHPALELQIASRTGKYEEEGWRVRKSGERFWANVLITAIYGDNGELLGFAKITRDLTERRAAEARALDAARRVAAEEAGRRAAEALAVEMSELAARLRHQTIELETRRQEADEARTRADEANQVKGQFLAAMSHELRTPLNAIGGYADLLAMEVSGPITEHQREQLARIKRSQSHLLRIINDILNFSRIEAGQLRYEMAPMLIDETLKSVAQMIAPQAAAKDVHFIAEECPADACVYADRAKVDQILLNLLSNAIKFTPPGGTVSITCDASRRDQICIIVRDTGVGIVEEQLEAIFEPFVQLGRSLTNVREGTGLGLAISRDLARAMRGNISAESVVGKGSAFTLTLPRA